MIIQFIHNRLSSSKHIYFQRRTTTSSQGGSTTEDSSNYSADEGSPTFNHNGKTNDYQNGNRQNGTIITINGTIKEPKEPSPSTSSFCGAKLGCFSSSSSSGSSNYSLNLVAQPPPPTKSQNGSPITKPKPTISAPIPLIVPMLPGLPNIRKTSLVNGIEDCPIHHGLIQGKTSSLRIVSFKKRPTIFRDDSFQGAYTNPNVDKMIDMQSSLYENA